MLRVILDLRVLELSTNKTLESEDGILGVHDGLTLGWETNQTFSVLCERDNGRSRSCTLSVFNNPRRLALHDRDTRICRSQINSNNRT